MNRFLWSCLFALLIIATVFTGSANATQTHLLCVLQGTQSVPPDTSHAWGYGEFLLDDYTMTLDYEIHYYGLSGTETGSHIHSAARGSNGGVTWPFTNNTANKVGTLSGLTTAQITSILGGGTYVNVHTALFPNGEIRGQIEVINYVSTIEAAQEVPGGDSPGLYNGWFVYNATRSALEYYIESMHDTEGNEDSTQIQGPAAMGANSTAVMSRLPLGFPKVGEWTGMTAAQMTALTGGMTFVNVHTDDAPDGEVRGQIVSGNIPMPASRTGLIAIIQGAQETPPNTSAATGYAVFELNTLTHTLSIAAVYSGLTPSSGHIHQGPRGTAGGVVFPLTGATASPVYATWSNLTTTQQTAILAGGMYINFHTTAFPNGEIRGQIEPVNYFAELSGDNEVPPDTTYSSAKAWFVLGAGDSTMEYLEIPYGGPIPGETDSHIHAPAGMGANAGVIFPLGRSEPKFGMVHNITAQQAGWIMNDSAYMNIHTTAHPGGEIRGWIMMGNIPFPSEDLAVNEPRIHISTPNTFELLSAYPNPFNPTTRITVNMQHSANVKVAVFDENGREVAQLHQGALPAGVSSFTFDGARLPSGIYFVRANGGNINAVKKVALLK